jgi:hypothetical protein
LNVMIRTTALLMGVMTLLCRCYNSNGHSSDSLLSDDMQESGVEEIDEHVDDALGENERDAVEEDALSLCDMGMIGDGVQLTYHESTWTNAGYPKLSYTGSEFGLAWIDNRLDMAEDNVYFNRLSLTGAKLMDDVRLSIDVPAGIPSLAFASVSGEFVVIWAHYSVDPTEYFIDLARVSYDGELIESGMVSTTNMVDKSYFEFVSAPSGYGLFWAESTMSGLFDLKFIKLGLEGENIGEEATIAGGVNNCDYNGLVYTGSEFAAVWHDDESDMSSEYYKVYFARISDEGSLIGEPLPITDVYTCKNPSMVYTGSEFAVVCVSDWPDFTATDVYLIRLSLVGQLLDDAVVLMASLSNCDFLSLAFSGREFGLLWTGVTLDQRVFFGRFLPDGTPIGEPLEIISNIDVMFARELQLVWTGNEYVVVWDSVRNIFFSRIGCLP